MKRAARLHALPVFVDAAAPTPLWRQLSISLRMAIANGRLRPGGRLPSTRGLARQINVSRNTVVAAYDDLADRGLIIGCIGAGSFVARTVPACTPAQIWFQDVSNNLLALAALP
jgi:GntR family transcriptional regulator/MocR family aminotransferase